MIRYIENGFKCYIAPAPNGTVWAFVAVKEGHPWHGVQHYDTDLAGLMWTSTSATLRAQTSPDLPQETMARPNEWLFGVQVDPSEIPEGEVELVAREAIWSIAWMLMKRPPVKN